MRRILFISLFVLIFFLVEFFLFNLLGRWFLPNLLLLLIMFVNLYLGIRYSILAAFLAGFLKDSFSTQLPGFYLLPFLVCAYVTTLLKNWVYHRGSPFSRLILIMLVSITHVFTSFIIYTIYNDVSLGDVLKYVFVPQVGMTLLIAPVIFKILKICVSRFYV